MEGNQSFSEIINNLYRTFFDLLRNIASLALIEAKQVKWALARMAILLFLVILSTIFTWLGICSLICLFLMLSGVSLIYSLFCVTALNIFILIASSIFMLRQNKNAIFSATTRQLRLAMNHSKDIKNE